MRRSARGRGKALGTSGNTSQHNPPRATLTDEETARIMKSEPFLKFFSSASKLIEVAITEENTLGMENYSEDLTTDDATKLMSLHRVFSDDKWSKGRSVTSLDWSPRFGELVMSSHGSREAATNEAEGVCIIWNIKYKRETPEYVFTSESPLVSTRFHPYTPRSQVLYVPPKPGDRCCLLGPGDALGQQVHLVTPPPLHSGQTNGVQFSGLASPLQPTPFLSTVLRWSVRQPSSSRLWVSRMLTT